MRYMMNWYGIKPSPIPNDTILMVNRLTGVKERVDKMFLMEPVRVFVNDITAAALQGFLPHLLDNAGECILSDTMARALIPMNVKRPSPRHKPTCQCEKCTVVKTQQTSLNHWRSTFAGKKQRELDELRAKPAVEREEDAILQFTEELQGYKNQVHPGGKTWHMHPRDAIKEFMCPEDPDLKLPKVACALRECPCCPDYQVPKWEQETGPEAETIKFEDYVYFTKCRMISRS